MTETTVVALLWIPSVSKLSMVLSPSATDLAALLPLLVELRLVSNIKELIIHKMFLATTYREDVRSVILLYSFNDKFTSERPFNTFYIALSAYLMK